MIITEQFLITQYNTLGKSGYQIAKELGVPRYTVDNAITKFNIPRRSLSVARLPEGSTGMVGFKWCPHCRKDKEITHFSKGNGRLGRDSLCKDCKSKYSKIFFEERNQKRQIRKAKLVLEFGNKCEKCGVEDLPIGAFVFHHHSEKMSSKNYIKPSFMISNKQLSLSEERKKWILLCANCHHIVHSNYLSATKY